MTTASMIGGAVVIGVVAFIIGFIIWTFGGNKFFWRLRFRKQLPKAREFMKELDSKYPIEDITDEMRAKREKQLANLGYNVHIIEHAIKLNKKERIKNAGKGHTRTGTDTGAGKGAGTNAGVTTDRERDSGRNPETELKRVLPTSKNTTDVRAEQPSEWDWGSFSKNR